MSQVVGAPQMLIEWMNEEWKNEYFCKVEKQWVSENKAWEVDRHLTFKAECCVRNFKLYSGRL